MEHKCLNILLVILLYFINSVYNRPKSNELKHQQGDISEMVKSDRVVEAANEDFMNIEGMEKRADGKLYFHGEKVKSVSTFGGDKVFEQPEETEYGSDYETDPSDASNEKDTFDNKLESLGDITNIEKIKQMTPIKNIQEVLGIQEIKNIEEIRPDLAEKFIQEENLENIIDQFALRSEENEIIDEEIEILQKQIDVLASVKQLHNKQKEAPIEIGKERDSVMDYGESSEEIEDDIGKVVDVQPIKSLENIKSIQPIKSIKPVVRLYALTEEEASQLKNLINGPGGRR